MKICVNCKAEIEDTAKFCNNCGTKVEEQEPLLANDPMEYEEEGTVILDEVPEVVEAVAVEEPVEEAEVNSFVEEIVEEENVVFEKEPQSTPADEPVEVKEEIPCEIPAAIATVSAKAAREAEKLTKKAAAKAEKLAAKAEKKAKELSYKENVQKKKCVTFLGVVAAIILSVFLIVNLAVVFVSSVGAGICLSNIEKAQFEANGEMYSLDSLVQMTSALDDSDMTDLLYALVDSDLTADIVIDGEVYSMQLSEDTITMIDETLRSGESFAKGIIDAITSVKHILFEVFIGMLCFAGIFAVICTVASVASIGGKRRALMLPGFIYAILGFVLLVSSLILTFAPIVLGLQAFEAISALSIIPMFANITSGAILLIGAVLLVIALPKKKN